MYDFSYLIKNKYIFSQRSNKKNVLEVSPYLHGLSTMTFYKESYPMNQAENVCKYFPSLQIIAQTFYYHFMNKLFFPQVVE